MPGSTSNLGPLAGLPAAPRSKRHNGLSATVLVVVLLSLHAPFAAGRQPWGRDLQRSRGRVSTSRPQTTPSSSGSSFSGPTTSGHSSAFGSGAAAALGFGNGNSIFEDPTVKSLTEESDGAEDQQKQNRAQADDARVSDWVLPVLILLAILVAVAAVVACAVRRRRAKHRALSVSQTLDSECRMPNDESIGEGFGGAHE
ncbi:unnamed protein product [Ostreobium quekettii]|uniref:Transmembrane protein n=1 Tax=Ostreobium quekettii TaxID=121088 RepID=A0A8S1JCJ8_9CHLO|nr:unnamed protein product [Ostreobium quekettii]|eukprot:evm.model.scf_86.8 EVM.evm.TU.scf_86.8   scf_86:83034-83630(-)